MRSFLGQPWHFTREIRVKCIKSLKEALEEASCGKSWKKKKKERKGLGQLSRNRDRLGGRRKQGKRE